MHQSGVIVNGRLHLRANFHEVVKQREPQRRLEDWERPDIKSWWEGLKTMEAAGLGSFSDTRQPCLSPGDTGVILIR